MWEERDGRRTRLDGEKEIKKRISGRGRRGGGWLQGKWEMSLGEFCMRGKEMLSWHEVRLDGKWETEMSVKEFGRILHERERNELDGWYIWKGLEASYMGISL